jgi:hypothetical protein
MGKLEPIKWEILNTRLTGKTLEEATKLGLYEIVNKLNEVIDLVNSSHADSEDVSNPQGAAKGTQE